MNTLRIIVDICLLRGRAQDLPASRNLVWLAAFASVAVETLGMPERGLDVGRLLFLVSQVALFGGAIWLVLRLSGFPARWLQTVSALYSANAIFSLLLVPFLPALAEMIRQGPGATLAWQGYVSLLLSGWFLAVMTRVLREATEWSLGVSLLASIGSIVAVRVLGFLTAPLFGFAGQA